MTSARRYSMIGAAFAGASALLLSTPVSADNVLGLKVIREARHGQTPPLRNLIRDFGQQQEKAAALYRQIPLHGIPLAPDARDALGNTTLAAAPNTTDLLNFEGIDMLSTSPEPQATGAAGATQYVQWVNFQYEIFDKATGASLSAPINGNTLWLAAFGPSDPCGSNNSGDPVVLYDKAAGRWVLEQPELYYLSPYFMCVAVSTTSDALGSYNLYEFPMGHTQYPTNPRLGIWPASGNSGYFLNVDNFPYGGGPYTGSMLCGMDRTSMLAGNAATMQCFQLSASHYGVLPGDFDGTILPPSGEKETFADFTGNGTINFWAFHADFANPANTTLAGPLALGVPNFNALCGKTQSPCVPQKGVSTNLVGHGDRLMYRLAYRNFGDHESLITNHSVSVKNNGAVRWYEFRNPANPALFQSGNVADSALSYWMGSAAIDKAGNIAVGFSASSSKTYPSINYAGRSPGDPAGTMSVHAAPTTAGGGSENQGGQWGERSALSVDPVDDCTFFYTAEYLQSTGYHNWSTRVNSFKFNNCN